MVLTFKNIQYLPITTCSNKSKPSLEVEIAGSRKYPYPTSPYSGFLETFNGRGGVSPSNYENREHTLFLLKHENIYSTY